MNEAQLLLILATLIGLVFFIFFLRRPDLGLLIVLFARGFTDASLAHLREGSNSGDLLLSPNVGLILILVIGGTFFLLSRRAPIISLPAASLLVLLVLVGLVGISRSEDRLVSVYAWFRNASSLFPYALAAYLFRTPQRVQKVVDVFAASFPIPALVGLYQGFTGGGMFDPGLGHPRVYGTFVHPNAFGIFLVVCLSVFTSQALVQSGGRRLLASAIVGLSGALLVATYARASWVGAIIVLLTIGILSRRVLLILVTLATIFMVGLVPAVASRAANPLGGSFADRVDLWQFTLSHWLRATEDHAGAFVTALNRVAGTGPGSTESLTFNYIFVREAAHNDYLHVLAEYGVLGLIAFVVQWLVLMRFAYGTWRQSADKKMASVALSFLALTFAYPVMGITDNVFAATQNQVYFWTLAGLTVGIRHMSLESTVPWPSSTRSVNAFPRLRTSEISN